MVAKRTVLIVVPLLIFALTCAILAALTQFNGIASAVLIGVYVVINLATLCVFWYDKRLAGREGARRVRERTLLTWCAVGGSMFGCIAMEVFRHKSQKAEFRRPYWIIVAVQFVVWVGLIIAAGYQITRDSDGA
jgi:uncharacterized membrane protein YsdA (DUF1294 family)